MNIYIPTHTRARTYVHEFNFVACQCGSNNNLNVFLSFPCVLLASPNSSPSGFYIAILGKKENLEHSCCASLVTWSVLHYLKFQLV